MKIFFVAFFVLASLSLAGQNKESGSKFDKIVTAEQLSRLSRAADLGVAAFDARYEGVKGTPFLFEDWKSGYIETINGVFSEERYRFNLNLESGEVFIKMPEDRIIALASEQIRRVVISDDVEREFLLAHPFEFDKRKEQMQFVEVLYHGPTRFGIYHRKVFYKADYKGAYSSDIRYDEYKEDAEYVIWSDKKWHEIKLRKKAILDVLPDLGAFLKDKKPTAAQLKAALEQYDTIKRS